MRDEIVYVIRWESVVKIGTTWSLTDRLKALQVASPVRLEVDHVVRGGIREERALHRLFDSRRLHGEWFRLSREEVAPVVSAMEAVPVVAPAVEDECSRCAPAKACRRCTPSRAAAAALLAKLRDDRALALLWNERLRADIDQERKACASKLAESAAAEALLKERLAASVAAEALLRENPAASVACSFCGREQYNREVLALLRAGSAFICDLCVDQANLQFTAEYRKQYPQTGRRP